MDVFQLDLRPWKTENAEKRRFNSSIVQCIDENRNFVENICEIIFEYIKIKHWIDFNSPRMWLCWMWPTVRKSFDCYCNSSLVRCLFFFKFINEILNEYTHISRMHILFFKTYADQAVVTLEWYTRTQTTLCQNKTDNI